jgi:lysophospholipase L1-like esterase
MRITVCSARRIFTHSVLVAAAFVVGCGVSQHFLQKGDRIIFFGDSITQLGVKPRGYVTIIQDSLRALPGEINAEVIGAGISGNKVTDLQKRLQHDVLDKKPTIVVIYIGINDVWHYALPNLKGTPKEEFESGLKEIIAAIHNTGARVILCTPSVVGEKNDGTNPQDAMLDEYSAISRQVAQETKSTLCDLRDAFTQYLRFHNPNNAEKGILTYDRVHLNDEGNRFLAEQILRILTE